MRSIILGQSAGQLAAAIAASMADSGPIMIPASYGSGVRRYETRRHRGWIPANINRWTGRPHEHKREIARRLRQAGRAGA
ncbi:hypothetical protein [Novosphingobium sp. KN65.2]|uniref:hypothetical protein n=1 Tax=Novosphingobium sp. KN65.2 TaxID=1478134 RepID=UPI0005E4CA04|nr:hypothetical protein [Novosphingobium sp. KN65.2]CDO37625.1 exported hypothetical protein [Novosphingobium sp. KN65.2]